MSADRLYAALLHLYPKEFREEYGEEMLAAVHELRRAGRLTPVRFWLFIVGDTVTAVARERLEGARWLATAMFGLLATVAAAHAVTFTYRYFYHPYFEGLAIPVLPYGAALGLVLGASVAAAQWMLFPARERRASHWLLVSAVTLPVAILFCSAAIEQALDGLNPVIQIHHPIALDVLAIGLRPANWNAIATQFVAMVVSALLIRGIARPEGRACTWNRGRHAD